MNTELLDALPVAVVTETAPVVAPAGTVAVREVPDPVENVVAGVPLKETPDTSDRPEPLIVTLVPTAPCVGVNEPTSGVHEVVFAPVEPTVTWTGADAIPLAITRRSEVPPSTVAGRTKLAHSAAPDAIDLFVMPKVRAYVTVPVASLVICTRG